MSGRRCRTVALVNPFRWSSLTGVVGGSHIAPYRVADLARVRAWLDATGRAGATVARDVDRIRVTVPKRELASLDGLAADLRAEGVTVEPVTAKNYARTVIGLHLVDPLPYGSRLVGPVAPTASAAPSSPA